MKIVWTEPAQDRLAEIEEFIAQDSPEHAVRFVSALLERAQILADFPESGRIVPEDEDQRRRELTHEGYRIIYRVEGKTVYVLSVFEGSRLIRAEDMK